MQIASTIKRTCTGGGGAAQPKSTMQAHAPTPLAVLLLLATAATRAAAAPLTMAAGFAVDADVSAGAGNAGGPVMCNPNVNPPQMCPGCASQLRLLHPPKWLVAEIFCDVCCIHCVF